MAKRAVQLLVVCLTVATTLGFQPVVHQRHIGRTNVLSSSSSSSELEDILSSRLPTSVDDQVRQAVDSLKRASDDNRKRHSVRLLLPVIGATELDDWPGGARQMMQAANPLVTQILESSGTVQLNEVLLDANDGVYAIMAQAELAADDSCTVLLPSADNIKALLELDGQVGSKRNLMLVNAQWKRRSDFGGFFGNGDLSVTYTEKFEPTFSLTNLICEGDSIRVLRNYPGPWRVFVRKEDEVGVVDWVQIGSKDVIDKKPSNWDSLQENKRDGGRLFDFGQPTYQEINDMLTESPDYKQKSLAERAAAAFTFIKDTL